MILALAHAHAVDADARSGALLADQFGIRCAFFQDEGLSFHPLSVDIEDAVLSALLLQRHLARAQIVDGAAEISGSIQTDAHAVLPIAHRNELTLSARREHTLAVLVLIPAAKGERARARLFDHDDAHILLIEDKAGLLMRHAVDQTGIHAPIGPDQRIAARLQPIQTLREAVCLIQRDHLMDALSAQRETDRSARQHDVAFLIPHARLNLKH